MRELSTNHTNSLSHGVPRTALRITLGGGQELLFATGEFDLGGELFLGKISVKDALTLDLTSAQEGQQFNISNVELSLGHLLINTPNVLDNCAASVYGYHKNKETGEEFLDEKMFGEIRTSDIDGELIDAKFVGDVDAAGVYQGELIAGDFPDAQIEQINAPSAPVFNDIVNVDNGDPGYYGRYPVADDPFNGGMYVLPQFELNLR